MRHKLALETRNLCSLSCATGVGQGRQPVYAWCVTTPLTSYAHGTSTTPLLGETIGQNLRRTVARFGTNEALVVGWQGYRATYEELWEATTALAKGMLALGIAKGDRVGLLSPNRYEWVVTQYAAARVGAILVNINPAYKTHELSYVLRQSGASVLFLAPSFRTSDYAAMVNEVRGECLGLRRTVVLGAEWDKVLEDLQREDRQLQDSTLLEARDRAAHDGHREGAEVQDARDRRPRARPRGRRHYEDCVALLSRRLSRRPSWQEHSCSRRASGVQGQRRCPSTFPSP